MGEQLKEIQKKAKQQKGQSGFLGQRFKELQQKIGYQFQDFALLKRAMMHSSYTNERHLQKHKCNERLEFLGDAVLELVTSEFLFLESPKTSEGQLTKTRASMVCEPSLAFCAREIELGNYLLLGKGEEATGGRYRDSILSDALEALIGAIYLDGGFANAKEFIHQFILTDLENKKLFFDSKTILQEMIHASMEGVITYHLLKEEGPDHNKSFCVEVLIGEKRYGVGQGRTKKAAEQEAAYQAILKLKGQK
jgi:ribonuclease-3